MDEVKIANVVSVVLSFPVISLVELLFLNTVEHYSALALTLAVLLHVIGPFTGPLIYKARKRGDIFVSKREDRAPLFIPAILSYLLAYIIFAEMGYKIIAALEFASLVSTIILFLITFKWKISIHMASLSLPIAFFTIMGWPLTLIFTPLIPLLAWARIKVKAHTLEQVVAGTIEGVIAAFAPLLLFT